MADKITDISTNDFQLSVAGYGKIVSDAEDIKQSIFIILFTRPGDDPMRPLFGCAYMDFIDLPVTIAAPNMVNAIYDAIKQYEPRVTIQSVKSVAIGSRIFFDLKLTRLSTGETIAFRFPETRLPDITGPIALCESHSYTYSNSMPGGTWSVVGGAAIDPVGGVLNALSAGGITITYTLGDKSTSLTANVSAVPIFGGMTGPATLDVGDTYTFTPPVPGGVWSVDDESIATIDAVTGEVTALAFGTVNVFYTVTNAGGCSFTQAWTTSVVNAGFDIILYPRMRPIASPANAGTPPDALGSWDFTLEDDGFIIFGALQNPYVSSMTFAVGVAGDFWGGSPFYILRTPTMPLLPQPALSISWKPGKPHFGTTQDNDGIATMLPAGGMSGATYMVFTDTGTTPIGGGGLHISQIRYAPIIVLNASDQQPRGLLIADLTVTQISGAAPGNMRLLFEKSHAPIDPSILRGPFTAVTGWIGEPATIGAFPDPSDPTNPDKLCKDYPIGHGYIYAGAKCNYTDVTSGQSYGESSFEAAYRIN